MPFHGPSIYAWNISRPLQNPSGALSYIFNIRSLRQLFVFYLVKLKIPFRNTILWCWIWPLIHKNHIYNLEMIKFKACSAPTCISIPFSNLQRFSQKISITCRSWTKPLRQNRKSLFQWKSPCSPKSMLFAKFLAFGNKTWPDSTLIWGRVRVTWRNWNFKNRVISWFTGFSSFVSTSLDQGCGKFLKHKR